MTPGELKGFRKTEAACIKALRNKKKALLAKQTENLNKEKTKVMLKLTNCEDPYKTRQSSSKAMNRVRTEIQLSPRKQAAIVEGLASEFGYQVRPSRNNTEHLNHDKIKQSFYQKYHLYNARER